MEIKKIPMDDRVDGTLRTKIVCILDCPNCQAKLKLTEQIFDNSKAKGELLILK